MRTALSLIAVLVAASALAQAEEPYKVEARGERYALALDVHPLGDGKAECDVSITDLSSNAVIWEPHLGGKDYKAAKEIDGQRYQIEVNVHRSSPSVTAHLVIERQGVIVDSLFAGWRGPSHLLQINASGAYLTGVEVKGPQVVRRVDPAYPAEARTSGVTGIVILQILIDKTGVVRQVLPLKELGHGLDEAATDAVKQWRFRPVTLNDKPVDVVSNLTVRFILR
ncbi:MAG TPA: energy transducer TonB [Thermoanaerobaculia bacterium]|nr:energy transducer TonB [Thermoanaerobaculia bacterium]